MPEIESCRITEKCNLTKDHKFFCCFIKLHHLCRQMEPKTKQCNNIGDKQRILVEIDKNVV